MEFIHEWRILENGFWNKLCCEGNMFSWMEDILKLHYSEITSMSVYKEFGSTFVINLCNLKILYSQSAFLLVIL